MDSTNCYLAIRSSQPHDNFLFADACLSITLLFFRYIILTDCNGERFNGTTPDGTCCSSITPINTYNGSHKPDDQSTTRAQLIASYDRITVVTQSATML